MVKLKKIHSCNHKLTPLQAKDLLELKGINKTSKKIEILLCLSKSPTPLSSLELFHKLGKDTCDLSTIHRSLNQFKERGLVSEIHLGEDFFRYELNHFPNIQGDDHHHHHHHIRCQGCGRIDQVEHCDIENFKISILKMGYILQTHQLEFTGMCSQCQ